VNVESGVDLGIFRGDTLTGAGCLPPAKSGVCPPDNFFENLHSQLLHFMTFGVKNTNKLHFSSQCS